MIKFLSTQVLAVISAGLCIVLLDRAVGFCASPPVGRTVYIQPEDLFFRNMRWPGAVEILQNYLPAKPVLFGSSEITGSSSYMPYRFFASKLGRPLPSFGREGNQSLANLINLMQRHDRLTTDSRLVFMLSPLWFTEGGIEPGALFEFVQPEALVQIHYDGKIPVALKARISESFRRLGNQINGLVLQKVLFVTPEWVTRPFAALLRFLTIGGPGLVRSHSAIHARWYGAAEANFLPVTVPAVSYEWNSQLKAVRNAVRDAGNNNDYGIDNQMWNSHFKGTVPREANIPDKDRNELRDLRALAEFLKFKKVRALFILQPLNRAVYKNSQIFDPVEDEIADIMCENGMTLVDLARPPYEKELLSDTMHASDYGWLKMNWEIQKWLERP